MMPKSFSRKYVDAARDLTIKLAASTAGAVSASMGLSGPEVATGVIELVTAASVTAQATSLDAFVKAAQNNNEYPILIIDEANLAFSPDVSKNKPMLDKLVQLTKQQREMMTLFTSSEHAYPYKL